MASKFVVFVVFAVVAQASLAAADVASARKTTHNSWYQAVASLYRTIGNPSVALSTGQSQYVTPASAGRQAFLGVAPQGRNQGFLSQLSGLGKRELGLIFGAIATARTATAGNYAATINAINNSRRQMPLAAGVKLDYQLAGSSASQNAASAAINQAFDQYYNGIKALATFKAGKARTIDGSSQAAAQSALSRYVDAMYDAIPRQG